MADVSKRKLLLSRWGQLHSERASWVAHWKEISDYLLPRSGRFFTDDRGRTIDVHALRHTFGTHLSKAGVPLRTAQAAMRPACF